MTSFPLGRSKIPAIGGLLKASSVSVILVIGQEGLEHMPPVTVFPSKSIIRNVVKGSRLLGVPTGNISPVQTMVMSAVAKSIAPSLEEWRRWPWLACQIINLCRPLLGFTRSPSPAV